MTMISAVSAEDRPYEKCMRAGAESLTDAELVAVIIRTGRRGASAVSLAENVLKLSGGFAGLTGLCHHSIPELMTIPGIGRVKAIQLQCVGELSRRIAKTRARELLAFPNADTIAGYYMEQLRHEEREHLIAMMLDSKNRMIGERTVSLGTVNAALLSPRELFLDALRCRGRMGTSRIRFQMKFACIRRRGNLPLSILIKGIKACTGRSKCLYDLFSRNHGFPAGREIRSHTG